MMIEKMRLAKKPYTTKWSFRKKHWYLFPQRWTWKKSVAEITYQGNVDAYKHDHFWLVTAYHFTWLFIDFHWELVIDREGMCSSLVRHEPLKYTTDTGEIFNH